MPIVTKKRTTEYLHFVRRNFCDFPGWRGQHRNSSLVAGSLFSLSSGQQTWRVKCVQFSWLRWFMWRKWRHEELPAFNTRHTAEDRTFYHCSMIGSHPMITKIFLIEKATCCLHRKSPKKYNTNLCYAVGVAYQCLWPLVISLDRFFWRYFMKTTISCYSTIILLFSGLTF